MDKMQKQKKWVSDLELAIQKGKGLTARIGVLHLKNLKKSISA